MPTFIVNVLWQPKNCTPVYLYSVFYKYSVMPNNRVDINVFGPVKNYWGYETSLAIIDDLYITKVYTPYSTKQVRYFVDEDSLVEYITLINNDRRF